MVVHRNINVKKFIYFPYVELDVVFGRGIGAATAIDVKCFFVHYLVVKIYNYVELEKKLNFLFIIYSEEFCLKIGSLYLYLSSSLFSDFVL